VAIAWMTYLQTWREVGVIPNLTWVPAIIILFPLILPASPRRTLVASALSASTQPLVLFLLGRSGEIGTDGETYPAAVVSGAVAVGFAYMGARVVYGLSRAVSAARELGSYRLEEKLGAGGMGEVWRASHRLLARPAALKLIRRPAGHGATIPADAGSRFEREAQVIARLRSPHTVTLFDFGVADDGTFYYAMELLDGVDADKFVRRFGVMPPARVVHVLRQMCHSLSEADACGLVHRDVKPANVFLCRYGEDVDFVKVLDFGLVKAFGKESDTESALTREHVVAGTPAFIAPEQALGAATVDGRVDIYATGCVAYWLLTGTHVFSADTPMGLLLHHAHTAPDPPSTRTSRPVPDELERVVMACLAKDPAKRPQSARELSAWLGESRLDAGWNEQLAREWWDRHLPQA
jgi:serine/threonine-protein kinase